MHPYRIAAPDAETALEQVELDAFTRAAWCTRAFAIARGITMSVGLTLLLVSFTYWWWFGQHCGFACM
jgi:hypothetical protein